MVAAAGGDGPSEDEAEDGGNGPSAEEAALFLTLDKGGLALGVHDPDFTEPLDGTFHIERGLRLTVKLECEDESLNFAKPLAQFRVERRDVVQGCRGIALIDNISTPANGGGAGGTVVLVANSVEERDVLLQVLERLLLNPRAFKRRKKRNAILGCLPAPCGGGGGGCAVPCRRGGRRWRRGSSGCGPGGGGAGAGGQSPSALLTGASSPSRRRPSDMGAAPSASGVGPSASSSQHHGAGHAAGHAAGAAAPGLEEAKEHARAEWSKVALMRNKKSSSTGISLRIPARKATAASGSGNFAGNNEAGGPLANGGAGHAPQRPDALDAVGCGIVLHRLLGSDPGGGLGDDDDEGDGGEGDDCRKLGVFSDLEVEVGGKGGRFAGLFTGLAASGGGGGGSFVLFEAFWSCVEQLILAARIWAEPEMQKKYLSEGGRPGMSLEKWQWFLVQVQDESRETVQKAEAQLAAMEQPDADRSGRLSIYGLSRYLCSLENSIFDPKRRRMHCDMTLPLTDFWIAASHHVHPDPSRHHLSCLRSGTTVSAAASNDESGAGSGSLAIGETKSGAPSEASTEPRCALAVALESGCRCLGLALAVDEKKGDLQVLLQETRLPFAEALRIVDDRGFRRTSFPVILVLHLALLPPSACAKVPEELRRELGARDRLWRAPDGDADHVPSPEDAKDKVIIVLAPSLPVGFDPALEPEAPSGLRSRHEASASSSGGGGRTRGGGRGGGGGGGGGEEEALQAWRETAERSFAVWPGRPLDGDRLPLQAQASAHSSPVAARHDVEPRSVGFVPCDELRALERTMLQQLWEHQRHNLTIAFPLAPRRAPANFNAASAWACGVQAAALDLSGASGGADGGAVCNDGAVLAHCGRFAEDNGGCGFVLKPVHLRGDPGPGLMSSCGTALAIGPGASGGGAPGAAAGAAEGETVRIDLRFVAGRAVPGLGPEGDSFLKSPVSVAVSIWGATGDCARQSYPPARPTGLTIAWPEGQPAADGTLPKPLAFAVEQPGAAVLVVELLALDPQHGGAQRLAFFACPVSGLRQGLRWVPLWAGGASGEPRPGKYGLLSGLLVHCILRAERRRSGAGKAGGAGRR